MEHRDIAIILGTGAENLGALGFDVGDPIRLTVGYSVCGEWKEGEAEVYQANVGGVPVHLLSRHSSSGAYRPAYKIDHASNMLALIDEKQGGAGAKVILASSLVGGCKTTDWGVGDIVLVEDGIDMHADDFYVDGNEPYVHAHGLFDREVSGILLEKAMEKNIPVGDGGVYYTGPDTTGNRFETKAEMARILAHVYLRKYLDALADAVESLASRTLGPVGPENYRRPYQTKEEIALQEIRNAIESKLEPNLVGMTLMREAGYARALSTRREAYKKSKNNKDLARFAGFAVPSDFPEVEETDHDINTCIALGKLPIIMQIFAEAVPTIQKYLAENRL